MRGDLETSSVVDLCRGLAEASSTGSVEFAGPEGIGSIYFRDGRVYWALSPAPRARLGDRLVNAALLTQEQLEEALEHQARSDQRIKLGAILVERELATQDVIRVFVQEQILDAVFDLMRWREGTYEFRPGEAADEKLPVDVPVDQLLVDSSRRQSEWADIERAIPNLDMVPDFRTGGSSAAAALEPDEFAMLASVDGQRSIRELASQLGYSEFEAARIIYGLTLIGVIGVRGEDEDAVEPGPPAEEEVEAEFDLVADESAEPDAPPEPPAPVDEIDVGRALEEALSGESGEPRRAPRVRVHVEDDGTFPGPDTAAAPPADAAVDEPPPADAAAADPDGPEPWQPDEADLDYFAGSQPEPRPEDAAVADEPEPEEEPGTEGADLDDQDFETLINQLAGAPSEPHDTGAPYRSGPAEGPDDQADRDPPTDDAAEGGEKQDGADVSDFLRELSRLAVEEKEERSGSQERPRGGASDDEEPPRRRPPPKEEPPSDDKKKKGGGFFGWGR